MHTGTIPIHVPRTNREQEANYKTYLYKMKRWYFDIHIYVHIYIYFARSRLIYKQDRGLAEGRSCNKKTGSRFRQNDISRYAASVWFRYRHSSRCHQLILFYIPSWVGILSLLFSFLFPLPLFFVICTPIQVEMLQYQQRQRRRQ